jgi:hypothetical protein
MPAALETTDKNKAIKAMDTYLACDSFTGITMKGGVYKIYPRVKHREAFYACVKEKGGDINKEWVEGEKKDEGNGK